MLELKKQKDIGVRLKILIKIIVYFICIATFLSTGFSIYKNVACAENNVSSSSTYVKNAEQTTNIIMSSRAQIKTEPLIQSKTLKHNTEESFRGIWIKVIKHNHMLYVIKDSKVIKSYRIAVGKNLGQKERAGDNKTPEGNFFVQQIQNSSYWTHDFKDGKGVIKNAYGPWFIRLKTEWNGIGIHGTHDLKTIGSNDTEGCVRLNNKDLIELKNQYIKIGMTVIITK